MRALRHHRLKSVQHLPREALINAKPGFILEPLNANNQSHSSRDPAGLKSHLQFDLDPAGGGTLVPQNYTRSDELFGASLGSR